MSLLLLEFSIEEVKNKGFIFTLGTSRVSEFFGLLITLLLGTSKQMTVLIRRPAILIKEKMKNVVLRELTLVPMTLVSSRKSC